MDEKADLSVVYFSPPDPDPPPHNFSQLQKKKNKRKPSWKKTQFIWQSKSTSFLQQMYKYLKKE